MFKKLKVSEKVFLILSLLYLVNIGVFVYQCINLVIDAWNVIPTIIIGYIMYINLKHKFEKHDEEPVNELQPIDKNDNVQLNNEQQKIYKNDNEDFYAFNTSFPKCLTLKSIIVKIVFVIIFIGLTVLFSVLGNNLKYDSVVKGVVVRTVVTGSVVQVEDGSFKDQRKTIMFVNYEFNDELREVEVEAPHIVNMVNKDINLCIDSEGNFKHVYDQVITYDIMFYTCIVLTIFTILGFVFKLPNQYLVMTVIMFLGVGAICLFNSRYWAGALLQPFTVFGGLFLTTGLMAYLLMIVLRTVYLIKQKVD